MKHRTFFWFILPSMVAMILFIAMPIVSVLIQSVHTEHDKILIEVENCIPLMGCTTSTKVDVAASQALYEEAPLGKFVALNTYLDRNHLAVADIAESWRTTSSWGQFGDELFNLPFYKALTFTLTYSFFVTPAILILGLMVALSVNALQARLKGPVIFATILPMIVTPLIGSLILFWMVDADGILGATLQKIFDDPDLSLKASVPLTWIMLIVYGIWHHAPFAFVVYYAALQTVPQDTLESAVIDGASRWQKVRYVVIPHLAPVITFISLISLMDNFRVFEPIIGFYAEANAQSLSWLIYNNLRNGEANLYGSAAATSMLTIIGVAILLTPVLINTWRNFGRKV